MNGRVLHLERCGHGAPLMLLHGFTGSSRSMTGLSLALAQQYETLVPDLPGHGRSVGFARASAYGFDDCLQDLEATLKSAGHERAHWLGYSMGARLALGFAVRYPERVSSLVLLSGRAGIAAPGEREARRRADAALAARIEADGVEAFVDEWMSQPLFASQRRLGSAFLEEQRRERLANDAAELAASLRGCGPAAQPPLFDELPLVRAPVLLIAGALDQQFVATARDLARRLPAAEVCVLEDAGHAAHLEQPDTFVGVVRDFLRRAAGPASAFSSPSVQETAQ
jgi:2-succinyl-6-hydroxy-2,4-cyclohexadiene-1-carboxylate synthase